MCVCVCMCVCVQFAIFTNKMLNIGDRAYISNFG